MEINAALVVFLALQPFKLYLDVIGVENPVQRQTDTFKWTLFFTSLRYIYITSVIFGILQNFISTA